MYKRQVLELVPDFIRSGAGLIIPSEYKNASATTNAYQVGTSDGADIKLESNDESVLHVVQKVVLFLEDNGFFTF